MFVQALTSEYGTVEQVEAENNFWHELQKTGVVITEAREMFLLKATTKEAILAGLEWLKLEVEKL
jgi:hypothetical protein